MWLGKVATIIPWSLREMVHVTGVGGGDVECIS